LTVEQSVLEYDLRRAASPIVTTPVKDWTPTLQHQDEVNQIALTHHFARTSQQQTLNKKYKGGNKNKSKQQRQQLQQQNQQSEPVLYMATADDAGMVRFVNTTTSNNNNNDNDNNNSDSAAAQVLAHDPEGVAVVCACAFRPGASRKKNFLELASGGTDCKLHLWDLLKPK
jgi:hypothetical protein